jgi:hypothetical protein
MTDLNEIMKQAKLMQEQFQKAQTEQLKTKTEGESGGNSSSAPAASKSSSSNKALERQLGRVASAISGFPAEITTAMLGIPDGAFKVTR